MYNLYLLHDNSHYYLFYVVFNCWRLSFSLRLRLGLSPHEIVLFSFGIKVWLEYVDTTGHTYCNCHHNLHQRNTSPYPHNLQSKR